MSFAYLPWYTGDYRRDTADLTLLEHGIYLLLLAYCWDSRGPVPVDEARAARIVGAGSDDERIAVKGVLKRYFVRHDDGWYNPRLDREIARANAISGARSEAGRTGAEATWAKRRGKAMANAMANAQQLPRHAPLPPSPTLALSPSPTPGKAKPEVAASPLPDWLPLEKWADWRKHRGRKLTPQATQRQLAKLDRLRVDFDVASLIDAAIESGWATFYPPKERQTDDRSKQRTETIDGLTGRTHNRDN